MRKEEIEIEKGEDVLRDRMFVSEMPNPTFSSASSMLKYFPDLLVVMLKWNVDPEKNLCGICAIF